MKAITIKQPWSTLIALGLKRYETRSWQTKYRGKLAIHAGKTVDEEHYEKFKSILQPYGIKSIDELPTGAVIAICDLTDCLKVFNDYRDCAQLRNDFLTGIYTSAEEYQFGDFSEGRYA